MNRLVAQRDGRGRARSYCGLARQGTGEVPVRSVEMAKPRQALRRLLRRTRRQRRLRYFEELAKTLRIARGSRRFRSTFII